MNIIYDAIKHILNVYNYVLSPKSPDNMWAVHFFGMYSTSPHTLGPLPTQMPTRNGKYQVNSLRSFIRSSLKYIK